MTRNKFAVLSVLAGAGLLWNARLAYADGIDIVPYLLRTGTTSWFALSLIWIPLFMLVNYALNFLVIGLPAIRLGGTPLSKVAKGLVALTLVGQLADRVGALLAIPATDVATRVLRLEGEGSWAIPLLAFNFLFSGLAVGALALYFLGKRWQVSHRLAWSTALAAGVLTNPAWVIGTWFLQSA